MIAQFYRFLRFWFKIWRFLICITSDFGRDTAKATLVGKPRKMRIFDRHDQSSENAFPFRHTETWVWKRAVDRATGFPIHT